MLMRHLEQVVRNEPYSVILTAEIDKWMYERAASMNAVRARSGVAERLKHRCDQFFSDGIFFEAA